MAAELQIDDQQPIDGGPLLSAIIDVRHSIRVGEDDHARSMLRQLHRALIAPVQNAVGTAWNQMQRLIIVGHGALHALPWPALINGHGRYLIEELAIVTAPSASIWHLLTQRTQYPQSTALLVGAPVRPGEEELRYAPVEMDEIQSRLAGFAIEAISGQDATEFRFRRQSAGKAIIHLATHGRMPEQNPARFHQILLAPTAEDDGILEADDLRSFDLRTSWLTTLNICDGGLYRFGHGDEPFGILPAVLAAGTASVIAPIWQVDDRRAASFFSSLYKELLASGPAESMRHTMISQSSYRALRDWSGYVLVGTGRPIPRSH